MSWTDKELRRRQKLQKPYRDSRDGHSVAPAETPPVNDLSAIIDLWAQFEQTNAALPAELQLRRQTPTRQAFSPERAMFKVVLLAPNEAGVGFTGDAIRYFWPRKNFTRSNNFWIRQHPAEGFVLQRRQSPSLLRMSVAEQPFDLRKIDHIFECLVTLKQLSWRSVGKRRFWLF